MLGRLHTQAVSSTDSTMTDEGEMKSGQIEEAACRPPRQQAAVPTSKHTRRQSLKMLRNLQFARWTAEKTPTLPTSTAACLRGIWRAKETEKRERGREKIVRLDYAVISAATSPGCVSV